MPKKNGSISPELHEEYARRLEDLLDERDDLEAKRQSISKALKGEIAFLDDSILHVRRVLKGLDAPQRELPGMEGVAERRVDPGVAAILKAAQRVRDREEPGERR